jgi:LacI family transcriptional regulator, galactose operon repressor
MRQLATAAGVSAMTVSLALRNSREVSIATRRRIQRLAAARGYRADPNIARLMHLLRRGPTRIQANIAVLVQTPLPYKRAVSDYVERLRLGLGTRAGELGYAFSLFNLSDFGSGAQLQRVLLNRGIEGIVLLPVLRGTDDLTDLLDWADFSTVSTTPSVLAPRFHSVMPNHFDNAMVICRSLVQAGYRRIGFAISRDWNLRVKYRWSGGFAWQHLFGGTQPVAPLITNPPGPELDPVSFAGWLRGERPDVVITDAGVRGPVAAVLAALARSHRPRMVTLNWPDSSCDAGIDQHPERIGSAAVDVLAGLLMRGEKGVPPIAHTTMIDGEWVIGKTWPKARRLTAKG